MSGGVDSSVAALLLQRQGYEVVGVTFKLFENDDAESEQYRPCCSLENVERARAVCHKLGVPHYTMSFVEQFRADVIDRFVCEYAAGRTPNPCVLCNRHIKFDGFLRKALAIGADFVATGHHARIIPSRVGGSVPDPQPLDNAPNAQREARVGDQPTYATTYHLHPGLDPDKDQSYALAHLNQTTMPHVLLPVGDYTKGQVRALAAEAELATAEVEESQDICFVTRGKYGDFLAGRDIVSHPGPIIDAEGNVLGEHRGLEHYTVGQRKNLGVSVGRRLFVIEKRLADNTLVVGEYEQVCRHLVEVEDVNWCDLPAGQWPEHPERLQVMAMLRYRQQPIPCSIETHDAAARIVTLKLQTSGIAAPGQLLALYDGTDNHVVMGGTIR
jgi:tRNA-uridine 2-sulfurtransferase